MDKSNGAKGGFGTKNRVHFWIQANGPEFPKMNLVVRLFRPSGEKHWAMNIAVEASSVQYFPSWWFSLDLLSCIDDGIWQWTVENNGVEVIRRFFTIKSSSRDRESDKDSKGR